MLIVPATGLAVGPLAGDEGNTGLDFVADPEDEPDRAREEIRESLRPINSARISTALLRSCIVRTKHERKAGMTRASIQARQQTERRFPVRVRIAVPPGTSKLQDKCRRDSSRKGCPRFERWNTRGLVSRLARLAGTTTISWTSDAKGLDWSLQILREKESPPLS